MCIRVQVTALALSSPQQLVVLLALPALVAVATLALHSTCLVESPTWLQNGPRRDVDAAQLARKRLGLLSDLNNGSSSTGSSVQENGRDLGDDEGDEGEEGTSSALELLARIKDEEEGRGGVENDDGEGCDPVGLTPTGNLYSDHRRRNHVNSSIDSSNASTSTSSVRDRTGSSSLELSAVWGDARLRLPSMVLTALLVGQQLSGINAVHSYTNKRGRTCLAHVR